MAKYSNTKAKINEKIATNGRQSVTGAILNDVLQTMVDSLGADYQFGGLVQPGSSFTAGEQPVVFLATTPGTYTNFGGLVVADGEVALLVWSGTAWSKQTPDIATRTEVSQLGQKIEEKHSIILIKGIASSGVGLISAVGDCYYNTTSKKIKKCTSYTDSEHFDTVDIDMALDSLYRNEQDNNLYYWDAETEDLLPYTSIMQDSISGVITILNNNGQTIKTLEYVIRIKGFATSGIGLISAVGDCYYNTTSKKIKRCVSYTDQEHFETVDVPMSITTAYINEFDDRIYIWDEIYGNLICSQADELNNIVVEKTETGQVVSLTADIRKNLVSLAPINGAKYLGKNVLDINSLVANKIINDSGSEVSDSSSSYFNFLIPCHGRTILSNTGMQRIYKYDASGTFLGRESADATRKKYVVPNNTYYIKIQFRNQDLSTTVTVVYEGYGDASEYEPFILSEQLPARGIINIYKQSGDVSVTYSVSCKGYIPEVGDYDFWEPSVVTDDYKCERLGQDYQRIPELTNTLKYSGFLTTYFDNYLGEYPNGYKVTKEDLGLDSGAQVPNEIQECPVYSYTFCPKFYNKTILLSAGMNTCEASTYFGLAYFVKALMEHTEEGMAALYNSTRFVIIPIICPSGIAYSPLLYRNANNVRINKNFSYAGSWTYNYNRGGQYVGEYPDSERETKMLKYWLNKYNGAIFYMDLHSDTNGADSQALALSNCFCSSDAVKNKVGTEADKTKITNFYRNKGYLTPEQTPTYIYALAGLDYVKHPYAEEVCNIPSLMHEQYIRSTAYGSNGSTNNDDYGIKNYVSLIRHYCLIMAKSKDEFIL